MSQVPVFDAKLFLECNNTLGEGILWDSDASLLRWVDIETAEIHSLDPVSMKYCVDSYPETNHVTTIALRQKESGMIATFQHEIALVPVSTPTEVTTNPKRTTQKATKILTNPLSAQWKENAEVRFNDGGCDPKGRFWAGTMTLGELKKKGHNGEFFRVDPDGKEELVITGVGTANGLGWSPDGKLFYWVDSGIPEISVFDYDLETGKATNRRVFVKTPPAIEGEKNDGVFDGLTMDGKGNVWVARWKERRVVGYNPQGEMIAMIRCPETLCTTIPCFGGKNLDTMYISTASSNQVGEDPKKYPGGGQLFKIDFGPGSEIRKLLGDDWTGAERHRFAA